MSDNDNSNESQTYDKIKSIVGDRAMSEVRALKDSKTPTVINVITCETFYGVQHK